MTRLSQIIAIEKDVRSRAEQAASSAYHGLQKPALLSGITRVYQPKDDDGEHLPGESTRVQLTVEEALSSVSVHQARVLDILGAKEATDQKAVADVIVNGNIFLKAAPVTFLLGLERQLHEELAHVRQLPTLDPAHEWHYDEATAVYVTAPVKTSRSKKIPRNHVKAEATDKHPAQVEVYFEDQVVGTWETRLFSGAIPAKRKQQILDRLVTLTEAVKKAREEANTTDVTDYAVGKKIFDYLYW